jgi:biopolymer transport protein ExbD
MKFKTRLKREHQLIDLTPLVDVIFLLLIFFLVTSNTLPLKSLKIENPKLDANTEPVVAQVLVIMDASQVIYVGSKKAIHDFTSLKEAVAEELKNATTRGNASPTIALSVDRSIPYELFLKLFSSLLDFKLPIRLSYESADT